MTLFDRLVAAFVAPAAPAAVGRWSPPEPAAPPSLAVLAAPGLAVAAGGAVALASGGGVVAVWGEVPPAWATPPRPAAKRLAARLAARGHDAVATGRLVRVALAGPEETVRVAAAAGAVGTVTVIAGPRDAQVDRVLAAHDRVLTAGDPVIAELAALSVAALGVPADVLDLRDAPAARALAAAGLALLAPWRAACAGVSPGASHG